MLCGEKISPIEAALVERCHDPLLTFELYGSHDVFGGQDKQLLLRVRAGDAAGVPAAFVGLVPKICGAF